MRQHARKEPSASKIPPGYVSSMREAAAPNPLMPPDTRSDVQRTAGRSRFAQFLHRMWVLYRLSVIQPAVDPNASSPGAGTSRHPGHPGTPKAPVQGGSPGCSVTGPDLNPGRDGGVSHPRRFRGLRITAAIREPQPVRAGLGASPRSCAAGLETEAEQRHKPNT
jgi:hypothetical protein